MILKKKIKLLLTISFKFILNFLYYLLSIICTAFTLNIDFICLVMLKSKVFVSLNWCILPVFFSFLIKLQRYILKFYTALTFSNARFIQQKNFKNQTLIRNFYYYQTETVTVKPRLVCTFTVFLSWKNESLQGNSSINIKE